MYVLFSNTAIVLQNQGLLTAIDNFLLLLLFLPKNRRLLNEVGLIWNPSYMTSHNECFFLETFITNSWELYFSRTKFFETYFLELTGRLLIYCWCLEFWIFIENLVLQFIRIKITINFTHKIATVKSSQSWYRPYSPGPVSVKFE